MQIEQHDEQLASRTPAAAPQRAHTKEATQMNDNRTQRRTSLFTLAGALLATALATSAMPAFADNDQDRRGRDDGDYRVDTREYTGDWRGERGGRRDDYRPGERAEDSADTIVRLDARTDGYRDRPYDGPRGGYHALRWDTLASLRTHVDGRAHQHIVLPRGTQAIRLSATHRRTDILAAYIEYPDGREFRVSALEGRLDGSCEAQTRLIHRGRGPAVLHLVFAPGRDGRRAYFDVLARN